MLYKFSEKDLETSDIYYYFIYRGKFKCFEVVIEIRMWWKFNM